MKHSDQVITLTYLGDKVMDIRGVGRVEQHGDTLRVATREQADRLLDFYNFEEVDTHVATEEDGE